MSTAPTVVDADVIRLTPATPTHWVCCLCGDASAWFTEPGAARAAGDRHAWTEHQVAPPATVHFARLWDAAMHCTTAESNEALVRDLRLAFGERNLPAASARAEVVFAAVPALRTINLHDLRKQFQQMLDQAISAHVGLVTATRQERAAARIIWDSDQRGLSDLAAVLLTRTLAQQTIA